MVRVLRYPYLTGLTCLCAVSCAVARDLCVGAGLLGWARVLLICTFVLLGLCFSLLSCRFFVDELGVGVGFLLRVRRTAWHELASVGVLSCNSRRTYLYGLYTQITAAGALALSLGIAIQNFPEGAIISMPLHAEGMGKGRAFADGVLSGIVEPIGAVLTILAARMIVPALPYLLSFAAGAMQIVPILECLPCDISGISSSTTT